jgi:predicted tellurium resistance membrane protein TerC
LEQLLTLLRLGVSTTLLDVDNALYMTATVDPLSPEEQKRAIRWGLFIEFLARLGLVVVFGYLASGTEVLFEVFGISFTVETLSLLAAGLFLLIRSTRDLVRFFMGGQEEPEVKLENVQEKSFWRLILEMSLVNALLSVDTVIALTGSAIGSGAQFWLVIFLLLFSAVVRLLFVQEIARFIQRYPATNIIILMFLIVIGLELTAQGLGARIPEILFNGLMLLALLVAVLYQLRYGRPAQARR